MVIFAKHYSGGLKLKLEKNTISLAKDVLLNESSAIIRLSERLGPDFEAVIARILECKGRLVITGIGKSGLIAQKMVATFNSTGTPALFMHAADAIHGDLGMIQPEDIVLCLSKSGNTPEVKVLVPMLKRLGASLIAMVGNTQSYLAHEADLIVDCSIEAEACTLNLAPTTSTTVTLAMGDAMAVCLLELRSFGPQDFARFHPGGALGKQLYLKVKEVTPGSPKPSVGPDAGIKEVIFSISSNRLGVTAVLEGERVLGIITDGDLRRALEKHDNIYAINASGIMTLNPKSIDEEEFAVKALQELQDKNIHQLLVTANGKYAGFIHLHELLREGIA